MFLFIVLMFLCLVIKKYFNCVCDFLFYSFDVFDEILYVLGDGWRIILEINVILFYV